ncbi:MAG: FKBP-type peptidyl-prolyl cis-trans isomerase [Chitinivibrionales bacterium]
MAEAHEGDKVKVHYEGKLSDGTVFDSSREREPLEFKLGEHTVIPGFENAVMGMNEGESKAFSISPDEAYGQRRDELIAQVSRTQIPESIDPKTGMILQVKNQEGATTNVTVTEVSDESVTLDGNHPLAGKELNFEIELVEIVQ